MENPLLLTPGPVAVPSFVLEAIARPVIPHRSEAFYAFYEGLLQDLQYLFQAESSTCCMIGSGTMGMEAAMYSLFRPGDRVLIVSMGKFSQRWVDYGNLSGLEVIAWTLPWGNCPTPSALKEQLAQHSDIRGIILTHCETSTGVGIDLEECVFAFREVFPQGLVMVDAITSVGLLPFYFDAWGLDCAMVASQKALMNPAGVCAFALSERAQGALQPTHIADSRNLWNYLQHAEKGSFPYTPPVQLFYGIQAALDQIKTQGLPSVWNQVHQTARYFRKGLEEIGGSLFPESPADSLTAFSLPQTNASSVKIYLEEEHNILLSGGQGALAGKILRASHMGEVGEVEMDAVLEAMQEYLRIT